jgi:Flp pilus assembly protein TadD
MVAACHWLDGDKATAERELRRLARAHPKVHSASCYLAALYLEYGQLDDAEGALGRAFETEPSCDFARSNFAILKFRKRQFDEAAGLWRAELAMRPYDGVVHANLGAALADGGYHEEALRAI